MALHDQLLNLKKKSHRVGIDLGGTKIEGILLDATGAIIRRERVPTPQDDYAAILDAVSDLTLSLIHI